MTIHFRRTAMSRVALTVMALATFSSVAGAQEFGLKDIVPEQRDMYDARPGNPQSGLSVQAWVDRRDATYTVGDTLTLTVASNRRAYITVLDVGTSGRVSVLFPNAQDRDNLVEANTPTRIPGARDAYRLRVSGPAGRDVIKVIATEQPLDLSRYGELDQAGNFRVYRGKGSQIAKDIAVDMDKRPEMNWATTEKVIAIRAGEGVGPTRSGSMIPKDARPDDLFRFAESIFYGENGRADYREALRWYQAAADAGHVQAMVRIGRMHEEGLDLDRSIARAMTWYRKAAELGSTQAMIRLGMIAAEGADGERQDFKAAIGWFRKAADQGDGAAMLNLARIYDNGFSVEKDPTAAARYILEAIKVGAYAAFDQAGKLSEAARKAIQSELRTAGLYSGDIDGQIGSATRSAMMRLARVG